MLLIACPHCGPRNADEFTSGGERRRRPAPDVEPAVWRAYLYERDNHAGWEAEQWFHLSGCRRFLVVERNTTTNEIRSIRDAQDATS